MLILFIGAAVLLVVDLITKALFVGESLVLIPGVLSVEPIKNYGAAFGIFQDGRVFLIIMTFIILAMSVFLYLYFKQGRRNIFFNTACAFVLGGALGNLCDRLFTTGGYVRDFIRFDFLNFINFPICNLADVFLNVGMLLLIVYLIFVYKGKLNANKS